MTGATVRVLDGGCETSDCWCVEQPRHEYQGKTGFQERSSVVCQLEFVIKPRFVSFGSSLCSLPRIGGEVLLVLVWCAVPRRFVSTFPTSRTPIIGASRKRAW